MLGLRLTFILQSPVKWRVKENFKSLSLVGGAVVVNSNGQERREVL
jgi:hypothetical protein